MADPVGFGHRLLVPPVYGLPHEIRLPYPLAGDTEEHIHPADQHRHGMGVRFQPACRCGDSASVGIVSAAGVMGKK